MMMIALMAMMTVGFTSCGSDDDNEKTTTGTKAYEYKGTVKVGVEPKVAGTMTNIDLTPDGIADQKLLVVEHGATCDIQAPEVELTGIDSKGSPFKEVYIGTINLKGVPVTSEGMFIPGTVIKDVDVMLSIGIKSAAKPYTVDMTIKEAGDLVLSFAAVPGMPVNIVYRFTDK